MILSIQSWATHNRAGEITYEHISGFTYKVTITTYTKSSSYDADRDSLPIYWGDNTYEIIPRSEEVNVGIDIKRNKYIRLHTYPGAATYTISMEDENRNEDIANIPGSVNTPFFTESQLTISPQEFGFNNSPVLQNPPIDFANIGQLFIHNPSAYDPDGDSLSYELVVPKGRNGKIIPGYEFPDKFPESPENQINIDAITGDFTWNTPKLIGEFNIAIKVTEYRNGIVIGSILRDMQIKVNSLENTSPEILPFNDTCVIAETLLELDIYGVDEDNDQYIQFSAKGGPFEFAQSSPIFNTIEGPSYDTLVNHFSWLTSCSDIRKNFYTFVFKIEDNFSTPLSNLKTWLVNVIAPAPKNLTVTPTGNQINLFWDSNYNCDQYEDFKGYTIWRKSGSTVLNQSNICDINLKDAGYKIIEDRVLNNTYSDLNLLRGQNYCYRISTEFAQGSDVFPYNLSNSLPSNEACAELKRDIPLISKVDIIKTANDSGIIHVNWTKPNYIALDTTQNSGPYKFELYRSEDKLSRGAPSLIHSSTSQYFNHIDESDTSFIDSFLNTIDNQYTYFLSFYANNNLIGSNSEAASIYLEIKESDKLLKLEWNTSVPWTNDSFLIYKSIHIDSSFEAIASVTNLYYSDSAVINERPYYYYIKSYGKYTGKGLGYSIQNRSQHVKGTPIDTVQPCAPNVQVSNYCSTNPDSKWNENNFANKLSWSRPPDSCGYDIIKYNIYYAENQYSELKLLKSIDAIFDFSLSAEDDITTWQHDSLFSSVAGCYSIASIDSFERNESERGDTFCIDNCPLYNLPNVFTPNNDDQNEFFLAYKDQRFINRIELKIYNRWGQLVFETENPSFEWNGLDLEGEDLTEGFYFYYCTIFEQRVNGELLNPQPLKGWVHLLK